METKAMSNGNGSQRMHTISVLVDNKPGVLARVSGLFARRGFNIESLTVSITEDVTVSRMTIVVTGQETTLEQITRQLNKLVDVIKVYDHTGEELVEREIALIKVRTAAETRSEIMQIVDIFRANIVDVSESSMVIECTGRGQKVDAIEGLLEKFGIMEMVRTGKTALVRGERQT
jgi:acetolactate synthase I/III small subunit